MQNKIISYIEMCTNEGTSLQKGMNFRLKGKHSVVLMSRRPNAPYRDRVEDEGAVLIYEGHDIQSKAGGPLPKLADQPERYSTGTLTENGKFHRAAQDFVSGEKTPDIVRVYEKIKPGIWSDNGLFELVDSWVANYGTRNVFKFKLQATDAGDDDETSSNHSTTESRRRMIPSEVKVAVWRRDQGKCVMCGAADELHFDHVVPFSRGGTSMKIENVQLLCARHNLQKSARIQ